MPTQGEGHRFFRYPALTNSSIVTFRSRSTSASSMLRSKTVPSQELITSCIPGSTARTVCRFNWFSSTSGSVYRRLAWFRELNFAARFEGYIYLDFLAARAVLCHKHGASVDLDPVPSPQVSLLVVLCLLIFVYSSTYFSRAPCVTAISISYECLPIKSSIYITQRLPRSMKFHVASRSVRCRSGGVNVFSST